MEEGARYGAVDAIKDTFLCQKEELGEILGDPIFIALAVILFLVCICCEAGGAQKRRPVTWIGAILVACGVLVSQFLCIFPVILGYHGEGLYNDRTKYTSEFEMRFSLIFAIIYVARYVSQILLEKVMHSRTFYRAVALCGVFVCTVAGALFLNNRLEEDGFGYSFELIRELANGTIQEVFSLRREVLDALEEAENGTDVYLQMPPMPFTRATYSQGISGDPGEQTNQAVASMFHLNTVAVEYGAQ